MGVLTVTMFRQLIAVVFLGGLVQASRDPIDDLLCNVCLDVVTDLDEWLTSDATEGEIIHFMESLCTALGAILQDLEDICIDLMESELPAIIEGLVEDNLDPATVCYNIYACDAKPTEAPASSTTPGPLPSTTPGVETTTAWEETTTAWEETTTAWEETTTPTLKKFLRLV